MYLRSLANHDIDASRIPENLKARHSSHLHGEGESTRTNSLMNDT